MIGRIGKQKETKKLEDYIEINIGIEEKPRKIKIGKGTVVTYIVAGLLLFLSNTEQFFEPALYYEISR